MMHAFTLYNTYIHARSQYRWKLINTEFINTFVYVNDGYFWFKWPKWNQFRSYDENIWWITHANSPSNTIKLTVCFNILLIIAINTIVLKVISYLSDSPGINYVFIVLASNAWNISKIKYVYIIIVTPSVKKSG